MVSILSLFLLIISPFIFGSLFPYSLLFFFFFPFLAAPWRMEFPVQESDPSCSYALSCSCGNAGSLTPTVLGWRSNLRPSAPKMLPIPWHHSGIAPFASLHAAG